MTTTIDAIYEDGVLKLPARLPLPEKAHVKVTIQSEIGDHEDTDRLAWLTLSEKTLTETWNNPDDNIFDELLKG